MADNNVIALANGFTGQDVADILNEIVKIKKIVDDATKLEHYDVAERMVTFMSRKWKMEENERTDPVIQALRLYIAKFRAQFCVTMRDKEQNEKVA